jgi:Spy/CpxP family protein refolding chaperone
MTPVTEITMKNRWIKVLLAASLAFNLAFVAAAIYRHIDTPRKIREKGPAFHEDLKLQGDQKEKIKEIIKKFKINILKYKKDILDKRIAIIEAMSDTEFNLENIEKKTGELNQLENELNVQFVDTLIRLNALLEPEQRLNFLYKLSQDWFFINKEKRRMP